MNRDFFASLVTVSGMIGAGAGLTETGYVFISQGTPSQPEPQPAAPNQPAPQPSQPSRPGDRLPQDRRDDRRDRAPGEPQRPQRPFTFQSPQSEARFTESSKRLLQMEQRMQRSNQELLRRLGEARSLTGERQSAALMDVLQQILSDQAEMQRYLAQARSTWSGDEIETPTDPDLLKKPGTESAEQPRTPDLAPRTAPAAPTNPR